MVSPLGRCLDARKLSWPHSVQRSRLSTVTALRLTMKLTTLQRRNLDRNSSDMRLLLLRYLLLVVQLPRPPHVVTTNMMLMMMMTMSHRQMSCEGSVAKQPAIVAVAFAFNTTTTTTRVSCLQVMLQHTPHAALTGGNQYTAL